MNHRHITPSLISFFAVALASSVVSASSIAPKPDNGISAFDVETGALVWANDDVEVGHTSLTLREDGLEVSARLDDKVTVLGFDERSGTLLDKPPSGTVWAVSPVAWPTTFTLSNGWTMQPFSPGNDQKLVFHDSNDDPVWTLSLGNYAHAIAGAGELVFTARDYLSEDAIVRAYVAGTSQPAWTFDLNSSENLPDRKLRRITLWPTGDLLIVQSEAHIFGLVASSGALAWHLDVPETLGLDVGELWDKWGIEHATIAISKGIMVVCYDREVFAMKLENRELLWVLEPDTTPHRPVPLVHAGTVYLSTGEGRTLR